MCLGVFSIHTCRGNLAIISALTARRLCSPIVALIIISALAYIPGLGGPFFLDDHTNINRLERIDGSLNGYLLAIFENEGRLLNRPLSYASFILNSGDWPGNPFGFKLVNLFVHLAIGAVLTVFLTMLPMPNTRTKVAITIFAVGMWLLNPLHVSTVLYAVQRMTSLSMLFSVISLALYLKYRIGKFSNREFIWLLGSGVSFVCAVLSKESGFLTIPLIGLLELYLRRSACLSPPPKLIYHLLGLAIAFFVIVYAYYLWASLASYASRPYSMSERFSSQGRVLVDYIYLTVIPNVNYMSLYHDGFHWRVGERVLQLAAFWLLHISVIAWAIRFWKKYTLISFGLLWFYIGHLIESTIIPLEFMFEHRNYLPSFGIALVVGVIVGRLMIFVEQRLDSSLVKVFLFATPLILFSVILAYRAALWGDGFVLQQKWSYYKVNSARAQYSYMLTLDRMGMHEEAYERSLAAAEKFGRVGYYLHAWRLQCHFEFPTRLGFPTNTQVRDTMFTPEIGAELKGLLEDWSDGRCLPKNYTEQEIDGFIDSILSMKLLAMRPRYKAIVLEVVSDYYIATGNYTRSLQMQLDMFRVQPTVDTAFRNIDFALKFGLYEYALEFLNKAKESNRSMPWLAADRSNEIEAVEKYILSHQSRNSN